MAGPVPSPCESPGSKTRDPSLRRQPRACPWFWSSRERPSPGCHEPRIQRAAAVLSPRHNLVLNPAHSPGPNSSGIPPPPCCGNNPRALPLLAPSAQQQSRPSLLLCRCARVAGIRPSPLAGFVALPWTVCILTERRCPEQGAGHGGGVCLARLPQPPQATIELHALAPMLSLPGIPASL